MFRYLQYIKMLETSSLCSVCGKSSSQFKTKKNFQEHSCRKNSVACDQCQGIFASGKVLKIHLETLHQKKI